jgi:hypothetical protein
MSGQLQDLPALIPVEEIRSSIAWEAERASGPALTVMYVSVGYSLNKGAVKLEICEKRLLALSCLSALPSVRLSPWNKLGHTGRIFMKSDT